MIVSRVVSQWPPPLPLWQHRIGESCLVMVNEQEVMAATPSIVGKKCQSHAHSKGGNTRGENPRDWAKKTNDIVE